VRAVAGQAGSQAAVHSPVVSAAAEAAVAVVEVAEVVLLWWLLLRSAIALLHITDDFTNGRVIALLFQNLRHLSRDGGWDFQRRLLRFDDNDGFVLSSGRTFRF
jgi:hypothetical protein